MLDTWGWTSTRRKKPVTNYWTGHWRRRGGNFCELTFPSKPEFGLDGLRGTHHKTVFTDPKTTTSGLQSQTKTTCPVLLDSNQTTVMYTWESETVNIWADRDTPQHSTPPVLVERFGPSRYKRLTDLRHRWPLRSWGKSIECYDTMSTLYDGKMLINEYE